MITITTVNIGDNIRRERVKQGVTQEQLAEMSDLSLNFISKIERKRKTNISIKSLLSISAALNISSYELLKGTDDGLNNRRRKIDLLSRKLYKLPIEESEQLSNAFIQVINALPK